MKEDWIGGKAEVSMTTRYLYDGTNSDIFEVYIDNAERNPGMDKICDVSRNQAKNHSGVWATDYFFMRTWLTDPKYSNKPYAVSFPKNWTV